MMFQEFHHSMDPRCNRPAFTLVEMLVAMAVTLLMMAALARAFGYIGEQVRDSRATLQMSSEIRNVTTRIEDELKRCTVKLEPNVGGPDQPGYLIYHEGPVTDVTSSIFRAYDGPDSTVALPDSRYGDFDDYLAFTAVAPPDSWFVGKVPRFILDQKTAEVLNSDSDPANDRVYPTDFATDQFTPVVIKSKYAEIIYFASPEYVYNDRTPAQIATTDAEYTDYLSYVDVDGNTDLNGDGVAIENGLPDRMRIYRRVLLIRPDLNLSTTGALPTLSDGTVTFMSVQATTLDWQVGMAAAHQQCDLSIRRVINPADGLPTSAVAANSLDDLAKPHNRFAHVRIPSGVLGVGAGSDTSMPVLALGTPATILSMTNEVGDRIAPTLGPGAASNDPVVTPADWCGFIRREFILGQDRLNLGPDPTGPWSTRARLGEDLLVTDALAFDLQIYDPTAVSITDLPPPPAPAPNGSGLVISPNDAGFRRALDGTVIDVTISADAVRVSQGSFVDLAYPVLAGGSLRGWNARTVDRRSTAAGDSPAIPTVNRSFLISDFSGVLGTTTRTDDAYQPSLYQSGRVVADGASRLVLFQPTFDTYTSHYRRDGYLQNNRLSGGRYQGTIWQAVTTGADLGANGIDDDGTFGADDRDEQETFAPFENRPEAIRVTVRLENSSTQQVQQASVVHRDNH